MNHQGWVNLSHHFSHPKIQAVFSDKTFPAQGWEGRKNLAIHSGFDPDSLIVPKQTHSKNVSFQEKAGRVLDMDGVFSMNPHCVCSIQVADCMPIYFVHQSKDIFGLVHAGWRGLVNGILFESAKLLEEIGVSNSNMDVLIGPSIQDCCFEVSDDVVAQFDQQFVEEKENGKYRIVLQKMAFSQLMNSGFKNEYINIMPDCTFCDSEKYHSYRRNGKKAGRMIGLLGIKLN